MWFQWPISKVIFFWNAQFFWHCCQQRTADYSDFLSILGSWPTVIVLVVWGSKPFVMLWALVWWCHKRFDFSNIAKSLWRRTVNSQDFLLCSLPEQSEFSPWDWPLTSHLGYISTIIISGLFFCCRWRERWAAKGDLEKIRYVFIFKSIFIEILLGYLMYRWPPSKST